ncbi:hypothetical protein OIU76_025240 [Salix suchowensis]|nr:hypothetical protein OIU76_025240 [Salix suchowensis]
MNNKGKRVKDPRDSPTRLKFRVWLMGWVLREVIGGGIGLRTNRSCRNGGWIRARFRVGLSGRIKRSIRGTITDYRTRGKDVKEHDIICRTSGVKASFNTTNTRDAFYRASIDVALNVCSSYSTSLEIDGEDPRHFIAGLAGNIGLESIRAARMVSAAVASRTRSCFLQAWALEVQGKHSEAVYELSKICLVLQTFPPEESSPEMEMVARGLARNLKVEQRELLMNMFMGVCSEESQRSAADALGLMPSPEGAVDQ